MNVRRGRLNNEGFIAMMKRVKISLLAVDESHCISQVRLRAVSAPPLLQRARAIPVADARRARR